MADSLARIPTPRNEPVKTFAPGTPERRTVSSRLAELSDARTEVPMRIGGRRVMTRLPGAEAPNGETRLAYPRLRPGGKRIHAGVSPRQGKRMVMAFLPKFG